jgi:ABC-2 type transport system permease protein
MVNLKSKKTGDFLMLANGLVFLVLLNILATTYFFRIDLTEEKRYTIKKPTKELLRNLDDVVHVDVYLEGDLNAGFKRLQKSVREILDEFRIYSDNKVQFVFTDPATAMSAKARNEFMAELAGKGINAVNTVEGTEGERSQKIVFPGALISYGGFENGVMLLKGNRSQGAQEVLNQSIEGLEFELANGINKLVNTKRKRVGFLVGHGELDSLQIAGLNNALLDQYDVFKVDITRKASIDKDYSAIIMAKPRYKFSAADKYKLDQYLMHGGKLLMLVDHMDATMDSASRNDYFAFPYATDLDDMFFRYGVRINNDLIQDRVAAKYPVKIGADAQPQLMDWPFYPLINQYADHAITRNLDATVMRFVNSMDSVKAIGVKKTPLLFTSIYTRKIVSPVKVGVNDFRIAANPAEFIGGSLPVAYLLEGEFTSLFKNRFLPEGVDSAFFKEKSVPSKMIVISDGDVARNEVNPRSGQPLPLGNDPFSGYTFANQDLLLNMIAYLTDDDGLIETRNKEVKIRPLDKEKIKQEKVFWQVVNVVIPLLILILFGTFRNYLRNRKYTRF